MVVPLQGPWGSSRRSPRVPCELAGEDGQRAGLTFRQRDQGLDDGECTQWWGGRYALELEPRCSDRSTRAFSGSSLPRCRLLSAPHRLQAHRSAIEHATPHRQAGSGLRLDARLGAVAAAERRGSTAALAAARANELAVRGNRVRVVLTGAQAAAAATAAGGTVEASAAGMTQALVPVDALDQLSGDARAKTIRPPGAVRGRRAHRRGSRRDERDRIPHRRQHRAGGEGRDHRCRLRRAISSGITEGDLSGSHDRRTSAAGSSPPPASHGTAVAEIVHEMAPGAQLYLICVDTEVDAGAGGALRERARDHGRQPLGRLVQHEPRRRQRRAAATPDAIVADARANGILWVNAAGNEGDSSTGAGPSPTRTPTAVHELPGTDVGNTFNVGPNAVACAFLKWDDWPVTTEDYDLYSDRTRPHQRRGRLGDRPVRRRRPAGRGEPATRIPQARRSRFGAAIARYRRRRRRGSTSFVDGDTRVPDARREA